MSRGLVHMRVSNRLADLSMRCLVGYEATSEPFALTTTLVYGSSGWLVDEQARSLDYLKLSLHGVHMHDRFFTFTKWSQLYHAVIGGGWGWGLDTAALDLREVGGRKEGLEMRC